MDKILQLRSRLHHTLRRLIHDESGAVLSIELILLATLAVIGLMVGLASYRDAIVQELGDSAASIGSLQQGYSIDAVELSGSFGDIPYDATTRGSVYVDAVDFCEDTPDASGVAPVCIQLDELPEDEQ